MKTFLLFNSLFCMILSNGFTQTTSPANHKNPLPVVRKSMSSANQTPTSNSESRNANPVSPMASEIIGATTYDLQTNASGCNRIYQQGGNVGASWTFSNDVSGTFPDRSVGYNYFDGSVWGSFPTSGLDSMAWPNIDIGGNTEYVIGHYRPSMPNDMALLKRSPAGSGPWTQSVLPADSAGNFYLWPRMRVGGPNGNSIHVIALSQPLANGGVIVNGVDGVLSYSRSQDGGLTWDRLHVTLPGVDASNYFTMSADCYAIDVRGSTVAVVQGSKFNPWVLWKSTDNGTTWVRTVIMPFPIPAYDPATMITDVDADAIPDTVDFIDGSLAVLIDNNNMVHTWAGRMRVYADIPGSFGSFEDTDGLLYWNQDFLAATPIIIASCEDVDGSGAIEILGFSGYPTSMTSFPTASIDAGNNIVLAYSSYVENTQNGNVPVQSYHNIYAMLSPDNGSSWSGSVRIEPSDFDEGVYPSLARSLGPEIHLIYQQDGDPGVSVGGSDPYGPGNIIYYHEDASVLFSGAIFTSYDYYQVSGNVYFDQNQNGIKEAGDFNMNNFVVQLNPGNQIAQTNNLGNYTFLTDSGSKTLTLLNSANWLITSDSLSYNFVINASAVEDLDFGVYPASSVYNVETVLIGGIPRCNNYIGYWISFRNEGTMTTSGTVRFIKDSQLTYQSATPPYNTASADTFEWNFTNLLPGEQRQNYITLSSMGLAIGDTIINCAQTLFDNAATGGVSEDCLTQYIVCSFDPNDKAVIPEGVGAPHYALLSDTLIYTIRFQNTGNDTAFTVRVRDTLDALLDPSTFRLLASSHPVEAFLLPGDIVQFDFENILLPDSNVNNPGSNGFVKYSIMPDAGISIGSAIYNTAHIFFDYNPAIVTNTVTNTMVDVIGLASIENNEIGMLIFPNPFTNETTLLFEKPLTDTHHMQITDLSGRIIMQQTITGQEIKIHQDNLAHGMYMCVVRNNAGELVGVLKLVVE